MKIFFAGATHLGLCLSVAAHKAGAKVVLFDLDRDRLKQVARGNVDRSEPGLHDFFARKNAGYEISTNLSSAAQVDIVVVAVDTRVSDDGVNDEQEVSALIRSVAAVIDPHIPVVVSSQVSPGFCRKHESIHPSIFYLMESLVFGEGIHRAENPERYVVGAPDANQLLPPVFQDFLVRGGCPIFVMNYESAELTKLSANFILASQLSAANSLAALAERVGAVWTDIEAALREDRRIGTKAYIRAGPGIAGSNILRDLVGVRNLSELHGLNSTVSVAMLEYSDHVKRWALVQVEHLSSRDRLNRLGLLGLAYKPGTESVRGGIGMLILDEFESRFELSVHDPVVAPPRRYSESRVRFFENSYDVVIGADILVIATPWPEYGAVLRERMASNVPLVILDPYRFVSSDWTRASCVKLIQFGVAPQTIFAKP